MTFKDGPYIQAACFCDQVIEDKSGVLSLIRVIDTLTHSEVGPNPPSTMPGFPHKLTLVIMMKSGKARGRYDLRIVPEKPSGESDNPFEVTVHFEGEEKGHNVVANMGITFDLEGLYWFKVYLDEKPWTAIPLRVKYQRVTTGPQSSAG